MYKFQNEEKTVVQNIESGQSGIHQGCWLWRGYEKWISEGGKTIPFQTKEEKEAEQALKQELKLKEERKAEIEAEKLNSGLKDVALQEARQMVETIIGAATTIEELKTANIEIWKKVLPHII